MYKSLAFLKHFIKLSLYKQKNPFSHPVYLTEVVLSLVTELIASVYDFVQDFNL